MAKDEVIILRVSADEKKAIKAAAKAAGVSLTAYLVGKLDVYTTPQPVYTKEPEAVYTKPVATTTIATEVVRTIPIEKLVTKDNVRTKLAALPAKRYHREPRGGYGGLLKK